MRFFAAGYKPPKFVEISRTAMRNLRGRFQSAKAIMNIANSYNNHFGTLGARSALNEYFQAVDDLVPKTEKNPLDSRKGKKKS